MYGIARSDLLSVLPAIEDTADSEDVEEVE